MRDIDDWVFHFERKAAPRLKEIFEKELDQTPEKMVEQLQRLRLVEEERTEGASMSLLFHDCEDLNKATLHSLTKAYEAACVELSAAHYLSSSELAELIDEMADTIRDHYRAGQRHETKLTRHAVNCALLSIEHRNGH